MQSWKVLLETVREKFYRQASSRIKTHQVSQQTFLGKLIKRRRTFALSFMVRWKNMVWWSKQSHKTWKTFWKWPQSLTAKTLSSDRSQTIPLMASSTTITKIFSVNGCKKFWTLANWRQCWKHTMFLYCDLVQNETLGDTQTALLRSFTTPAFLQRTNTEERWTTGAFQICSGREFTNHNSSQSLWLGQRNGSEDAFSDLWSNKHYFGTCLNHIEQNCVSGVTSSEDRTLPLQKLDPSCSSFRTQIRN